MSSTPLVHFAAHWPEAEKVVLKRAIDAVEPLGPNAPDADDTLGAPWVVSQQSFSRFTLYMAHRLGLTQAITARSAQDLAAKIRRVGTEAGRSTPLLFQLMYESIASKPMDADALKYLLDQAREKNERLGITGLLLYKAGRFMQILEGEEEAVRTLYATIRADDRHHDVETLLTTPIRDRTFPEWSMTLENIDAFDLEDAAGTSSYLQDETLQLNKRPIGPVLKALHRFRMTA